MTTIAFDGKTMAGDSCWGDEEVQIVSRTKISRFSTGALYGCSGGWDDRQLVAMLEKVKKPSQFPTHEQLRTIQAQFRALFVLPDGRPYMVDTAPVPNDHPDFLEMGYEVGIVELDVPCAVGSGAKFALPLMKHGSATAFEAVKAACDLDLNSRLPVTRLALHPSSHMHRPKTSLPKHPRRRG